MRFRRHRRTDPPPADLPVMYFPGNRSSAETIYERYGATEDRGVADCSGFLYHGHLQPAPVPPRPDHAFGVYHVLPGVDYRRGSRRPEIRTRAGAHTAKLATSGWQHAHRPHHLHPVADDSRLFGGRRMTTTPTRQETSLFDTPLPDPGRPTPGPVGRDHPETSVTAARTVAPKAATQREKILEIAYLAGSRGFIAAEAADVINRSRNQTAARMLELREQGWLRRTDEKRTTEGDNAGLIHVITDAGRSQLEATRAR